MKNLNVSSEVPSEFFDSVLASKKNTSGDPTYKARVNEYKANIINHFADYDLRFLNNTLATITPQGYSGQEKEDLLRLYKYGSKPMQRLKVEVTTDINNRIINTCQNCTINAVNSLDHVTPKEELSEFAVHPKNLFPSCTQCNGKKSIYWRSGGQLLFLNLYTDILPNVQYLFVNINYVDNLPLANFSLVNTAGINSALFSTIETHYDRLNLLKRFALSSNEVITDVESEILANKNKLPRQDVIDSVVEHHNLNRNELGFNHWKSLLSIELTNCVPYMDALFA